MKNPKPNVKSNVKHLSFADLEGIAKNLEIILQADAFIVTGSMALRKYGLVAKNHDIDIILVNPTENTLDTLGSLERAAPVGMQNTENDYDVSELVAQFIYHGVKVDVFRHADAKCLLIDGLHYSFISDIIKAKKICNRHKDWALLFNIAEKFCTIEQLRESTRHSNPNND